MTTGRINQIAATFFFFFWFNLVLPLGTSEMCQIAPKGAGMAAVVRTVARVERRRPIFYRQLFVDREAYRSRERRA